VPQPHPTYSHTQIAHATAAVIVGGVLLNMLFVWRRSASIPAALQSPAAAVSLLVSVPLVIAAVVFSRLHVEIRDGALQWRFGLGVFRRSIPLSRITSAVVVNNPLYYGWGRRRTPKGWLYSVAGPQSVLITTDDDTQLRLGSDEPDALALAIRQSRLRSTDAAVGA
jgi:hypothetical protein